MLKFEGTKAKVLRMDLGREGLITVERENNNSHFNRQNNNSGQLARL